MMSGRHFAALRLSPKVEPLFYIDPVDQLMVNHGHLKDGVGKNRADANRPSPFWHYACLWHSDQLGSAQAHACERAAVRFSHHLSQHLLVQTQVGNKLPRATVLVFELFEPWKLGNAQVTKLIGPGIESCLTHPELPAIMGHIVPFSACFRAKAICSSVNLDFFTVNPAQEWLVNLSQFSRLQWPSFFGEN